MSNCKIDLTNQEELDKYSAMFKALSNPARLRILLELAQCMPEGGYRGTREEQESQQQDFASCLGLAQSTVSHHIKELRQAGLLFSKRDGKQTIIEVNLGALEALRNILE